MRVQVVVQHHLSRAHLIPPLLARLPPDSQVVTDPGADEPQRSPWRCYRACLEALEDDASHLCVLQDDVTVCRDFPAGLELVISARPDDVICLFVPGVSENAKRVLDACYQEKRWCHLFEGLFLPVVAVVYPREKVGEILAFVDALRYPPSQTGDDAILGHWMKETGARVLACVPSLVEHADEVASLTGSGNFNGAAPHRIAACWIGDSLSPCDFVWH